MSVCAVCAVFVSLDLASPVPFGCPVHPTKLIFDLSSGTHPWLFIVHRLNTFAAFHRRARKILTIFQQQSATFCWRSWWPCILLSIFVLLCGTDATSTLRCVYMCVIYGAARPNEIKHKHRRDDDRQLYDDTKCAYSYIWLSAFAQTHTHTATNESHTAHTIHTTY